MDKFLSGSLCGLDAECAEFACELGGRFEGDGLHAEGAGRGAVFELVVDKS